MIAFARRSLKPAKKNNPAHKLEFLALKWAVCEKFHDYLYGIRFEAVTYRSGKKNADADGLSRCQEEEQHVVFPEMLKAISVASQIVSEEAPLFESVALSDTACSADTQEETSEEILPSTALSGVDWRIAQRKDPTIGLIIQQLKIDARKPAPQVLASPMYDARYAKDWNKLYLCKDILYRKGTIATRNFDSWLSSLHFGTRFSKPCTTISAIEDVIGPPRLSNNGSTGRESTRTSVTEFDSANAVCLGRRKRASALNW